MRDTVAVGLAVGYVPTVLKNGTLELFSAATGTRIRFCPVGTAMWLALCQHRGQVATAAEALAALWDADPDRIHTEMRLWAASFRDAGLLDIEP